ncbi:MAG: hypothetical protein MI723_11985, partial [Caulobacterales bacterium]|nr:hypothetical protein [Caulobacterales bacterium]
MTKRMTVADVIDLWPSIAAFAVDLGVPYTTAASWRSRNSIPSRFWAGVVEAAERRGVAGVDLASLSAIASANAGEEPAGA